MSHCFTRREMLLHTSAWAGLTSYPVSFRSTTVQTALFIHYAGLVSLREGYFWLWVQLAFRWSRRISLAVQTTIFQSSSLI